MCHRLELSFETPYGPILLFLIGLLTLLTIAYAFLQMLSRKQKMARQRQERLEAIKRHVK